MASAREPHGEDVQKQVQDALHAYYRARSSATRLARAHEAATVVEAHARGIAREPLRFLRVLINFMMALRNWYMTMHMLWTSYVLNSFTTESLEACRPYVPKFIMSEVIREKRRTYKAHKKFWEESFRPLRLDVAANTVVVPPNVRSCHAADAQVPARAADWRGAPQFPQQAPISLCLRQGWQGSRRNPAFSAKDGPVQPVHVCAIQSHAGCCRHPSGRVFRHVCRAAFAGRPRTRTRRERFRGRERRRHTVVVYPHAPLAQRRGAPSMGAVPTKSTCARVVRTV